MFHGFTSAYFSKSIVRVAALESVDLALGLVLGDTVALLDASKQLVALAGDHVQVVVGELAPLLLDLALDLLPISFDTVFVHGAFPI